LFAPKKSFQLMLVVLAIVGGVVVPSGALAAPPETAVSNSAAIPAQPLSQALAAFARTSGLQVVYVSEVARGVWTQGAPANLTPRETLDKLLAGTGLHFKFTNQTTVTIFRPAAPKGASHPTALRQAVTQGPAASGAPPTAVLNEVIVTAQKRAEPLREVPVPVTVLDTGSLLDSNQLRIQDYYTEVPGLSVSSIGAQSTQVLSIRGINTGVAGNPSVGIIVDDVPYGASTNNGGGLLVPDLDPGELAQVEVLRGPQGTLYGASSLGGLIKFVTLDPSTAGFSGRVQAGAGGLQNGEKVGYDVRGSINVPLSDIAAMRASGFYRTDPGHIDNPVLGINGINRDDAYGAHVSALWRPSGDYSVKLSALWQRIKAFGSSDVDIQTDGYPQTYALRGFQQSYLPGVGGFERTFQAYSATVSGKFGGATLTSVTGYNINEYRDSWDASFLLGPVAQAVYGPTVTGSPAIDDNRTGKFSQEMRLSGHASGWFDWLLGGFYTYENSKYTVDYRAALASGDVVGDGATIYFPTTYREYAAFADLTVHFTDQFDVQVGGRESEIHQTFSQIETGAFAPVLTGLNPPVITQEQGASSNAFTYLLTPRFKVSKDLMLYARLASGYRAGGVNPQVGGPNGSVPAKYDPDKTRNYEIGAKGDFWGHRLTFDSSLYYIDWRDIQVTEFANGYGYVANASNAKSQGAELSITLAPVAGLKLSAWGAWDNAVLKSPLPATATVYGAAGDRLPYNPRFSGGFSIDDRFPLTPRVSGFAGTTISYVGDREGEFTSAPPVPPGRQNYPSYTRTDLRAGVYVDSWSISLYVNNLTDRRGVLAGGIGSFPPFAFTYIQPRAMGISVTKTF
jgi:iron complex outermembrane receptor protein